MTSAPLARPLKSCYSGFVTPLTVRALFLLALAGPVRAGQIEAPVSGEFRPGTRSGAAGSPLGAPVPLQLTVPSLSGAAVPSLLALAPAPIVQPALAQSAAAKAAAVPVLPAAAAIQDKPRALAGTLKAAAAAPRTTEADQDPGRALFDQGGERTAEPAASGLWDKVKNILSLGEAAPAWPGKAGDAVRVGGIKTALDEVAGQGGTSTVWRSRDRNYAIKILHPGARAVPGAGEEAATLRAIENSDLPVAKLLAESRDGLVLVKEFIDGDTAHKILERGAFSRSQAEGWPELAAKLISRGVTADLARGNLVWQHWRTRWVVADGGGLTDGGPRAVLDQLLAPELLSSAGVDPGAFLSGLRARLGPDSGLWAETLAGLRTSPAHAASVAALARRDAATPAAPKLVFAPAPKGPAGLDDALVSGGEAAKRLGYDPLRAGTKVMLHGDDPGKLNTTVFSAEAPGRRPVVVKIAPWDVIQNEVALRRLARRFFGRYFRVPASVAVKKGYESYMVMEKLDAEPSHFKNVFNLEQRVAVALFTRTFGVGDVNPGNTLAPRDGGLPWLIDFEQALSRAAPVAGRVPDERIALEMPWMSRTSRNRVEDYQPAVRAWRAVLAKPETRAAILGDLAASGFTPADAAALLARFDLNAADLDWTLQNDADFVNQFAERSAVPR